MSKSKRSLKGTTLVEVIIALAVFAMLGVVLLQLGMAIDKTNKASSRLNKRVNIQAPYAAARRTTYSGLAPDENGQLVASTLDLDSDATQIRVSIDDDEGNPKNVSVKVRAAAGSSETIDKSMAASITINGTVYDTKAVVENNSQVYDAGAANKNHHLKFVVLDTVNTTLASITFDLSGDHSDVDIKKQSLYALPDGINWISSDEGVATVTANGKVHAVAAGSCTIVGTVVATGYQYTCDVVVASGT